MCDHLLLSNVICHEMSRVPTNHLTEVGNLSTTTLLHLNLVCTDSNLIFLCLDIDRKPQLDFQQLLIQGFVPLQAPVPHLEVHFLAKKVDFHGNED